MPWPQRLTAQIGRQLKYWRAQRGITARQLADRCEQLGYRVEYQVIANIEVGRRAYVGVAELLVFAAALAVPPALLLFPVGTGERVEPVPGASQGDGWDAYRLFTGELGVSVLSQRADETAIPSVQRYPDDGVLAVYRRHDRHVRDWARHAHHNPDAAAATLEALAAVRREMTAHGWVPPVLDPDVTSALSAVGQ
ncbi:hypothetical protein C8D89_11015 [Actinomycetospora cinnamomea]|uniref:HTH cro/C1-type domain-containing protein n=2 Tax=Actinomycetospora cinnamomea TaxID=663609 RepID=A0A2U1F6T6_9PSEU|nr:hypothetical protein C8D89_11015 [Actinomycetospora cinnamomea]